MAFTDMLYYDSYNTYNSSITTLPKEVPVEEDAVKFLLYLIACGQEVMPTGFQFSCHAFPGYGLIYLHSGTIQYSTTPSLSEKALTLKAGTLFLFDCRIPHSFHSLSASEYEIVYFEGCPAPFYCQKLFDNNLFPLELVPSSKIYSYLHTLSDPDALTSSFIRHKVLTDLLTNLLLICQPQEDSVPTYLQQIKKELEKNYFQSISLSMLESSYQVSRYRICKEFKTYFNISPIQYLHQIRVHTAENLLRDTTLKIHEISYEVGYENVNHFIAHFKKSAGTTPADYRKHKTSYI